MLKALAKTTGPVAKTSQDILDGKTTVEIERGAGHGKFMSAVLNGDFEKAFTSADYENSIVLKSLMKKKDLVVLTLMNCGQFFRYKSMNIGNSLSGKIKRGLPDKITYILTDNKGNRTQISKNTGESLEKNNIVASVPGSSERTLGGSVIELKLTTDAFK